MAFTVCPYDELTDKCILIPHYFAPRYLSTKFLSMAKGKQGKGKEVTCPNPPTTITLSDLKQNPNLWYKIHCLLHDLSNIKDPPSEHRTLLTTDPHCISSPYFTTEEASLIKNTLVPDLESRDTIEGQDQESEEKQEKEVVKETQMITIQAAIESRLSGFFEKRKASGDSRPCGPHDMAPVYRSIFGIKSAELLDERFLARLRRSGVGESAGDKEAAKGEESGEKKKKKDGKGKGRS